MRRTHPRVPKCSLTRYDTISGPHNVVRLYADQHPDDIIGLVLVDSVHEQQAQRLRERLSPDSWAEIARLYGSNNPEQMDFEASAAQAAKAGNLGSVPLAVLQADHQQTNPAEAGISEETATETDEIMQELWPQLQRDLANLSTISSHTVVTDSGHFIQTDNPTAVVDAVRSVLTQ
ncbi:MAG: hypothetical protein GY926_04830 [bacterium]|nr:hypothetical protein [bacterium]